MLVRNFYVRGSMLVRNDTVAAHLVRRTSHATGAAVGGVAPGRRTPIRTAYETLSTIGWRR